MDQVICYSVHGFEKEYLEKYADQYQLSLQLKEYGLDADTCQLSQGARAISCFAHDKLDKSTLECLKKQGVEMISLRSAGYSHLDIQAAKELGFTITRVPSYSPQAIAEHALGLLMCLNRKYIKANQRVRDLNFTLEGLQGHTLFGKTVGVIGAGNIGKAFINIMLGLGCKVLVVDPQVDPAVAQKENCEYMDLKTMLKQSDIISLHCPLNEKTHHIIDKKEFALMKPHVLLINTGRGALINTEQLIQAIKKKQVGGVALDVYEYEEHIFFKDLSEQGIDDDQLARLLTFPNVIITSHQAFFTYEALENIAQISVENTANFLAGKELNQENVLLSSENS
jgi:D-lactate dehydrogenase